MNLNSLEAFRHVVQEGTLTLAAKRMNKSEPAVSRLIRILEDEVDLTLFSRTRRRLILTAEGESFYRQVKNILDGVHELPQIASGIRRGSKTALSILTAVPIALSLVAPALKEFKRGGNEAACTVKIGSRLDIEQSAGGANYDIGLVSLPISHPDTHLHVTPICKAKSIALVPAGHRLAAREFIEPDDLDGESMVLRQPGHIWRQRVDDFLGISGATVSAPIIVQSSLLVFDLVREGLGTGIMDKIVGAHLQAPEIVQIPLKPERFVTYAYVHRADFGPESPIADFVLCLRKVIADLADTEAWKGLLEPVG